jgi:hypothetical protein
MRGSFLVKAQQLCATSGNVDNPAAYIQERTAIIDKETHPAPILKIGEAHDTR